VKRVVVDEHRDRPLGGKDVGRAVNHFPKTVFSAQPP
jgi:hypothetical protein